MRSSVVERMHSATRPRIQGGRGPINSSMLVVLAKNVADILAQETLDALAEFLHTILHPIAACATYHRLNRGDVA